MVGKTTKLVLLVSTGITILLYRSSTFIATLLYGKTEWWRSIYTDNWNHYQLGIAIIVITLILKPKSWRLKYLLLGTGIGMLIDEIGDIVKLIFPNLLPYHFRDSINDLLFIAVTYFLFIVIIGFYRLGFKRRR